LAQLARCSDLGNRLEVNSLGFLLIFYNITATGKLMALKAVLAYTQVDKRQYLCAGLSSA
jgi:hypothetical protein